jgi:hypothetical protein
MGSAARRRGAYGGKCLRQGFAYLREVKEDRQKGASQTRAERQQDGRLKIRSNLIGPAPFFCSVRI